MVAFCMFVTLLASVWTSVSLLFTIQSGRALRVATVAHKLDPDVQKKREIHLAYEKHKLFRFFLFVGVLLLVLAIYLKIFLLGRMEDRGVLFSVHTGFAAMFLVSFLTLITVYGGGGSHKFHGLLAYFTAICFIPVAVIGVMMMFTWS